MNGQAGIMFIFEESSTFRTAKTNVLARERFLCQGVRASLRGETVPSRCAEEHHGGKNLDKVCIKVKQGGILESLSVQQSQELVVGTVIQLLLGPASLDRLSDICFRSTLPPTYGETLSGFIS